MRKILAAALAAVMLLSLAACGKDNSGSSPGSSTGKNLKASDVKLEEFNAAFGVFVNASAGDLSVVNTQDFDRDGYKGTRMSLTTTYITSPAVLYAYCNDAGYITLVSIAAERDDDNKLARADLTVLAQLALMSLGVDYSATDGLSSKLISAASASADGDKANSAVDVGTWRMLADVSDKANTYLIYAK